MRVSRWTKLWDRFPRRSSFDLFSDKSKRESLLGVRRDQPETPEKIKADAALVLRYSESADYQVWSEEVWRQAVSCVKELTSPSCGDEKAGFYRGQLSALLDVLRISHQARAYQVRSK